MYAPKSVFDAECLKLSQDAAPRVHPRGPCTHIAHTVGLKVVPYRYFEGEVI